MKNTILLTLVIIAATIIGSNLHAQSWSTGTSKLYANPTTTNVGIGTTSPNSKLHVNSAIGQNSLRVQVNGSTKFTVASNGGVSIGAYQDTPPTNGLYVKGNIGIGTNSTDAKLHIDAGTERGIQLNLNHTENWGYGFQIKANQEWTKAFSLIGPDGNAKFTLYGNGNIAMGNSAGTPWSARLYVDGKILAEEIEVKIIEWPDYVFANEYKLPALSEVEEHIKKNKHLPNLPSAKEVEESGLNLGEMDKLLLQKIEELTLYTIEQQKLIEELRNEVNNMKNN